MDEISREIMMAGVLGFEPRMTESESVALPLGDTPTRKVFIPKPDLVVKNFPAAKSSGLNFQQAPLRPQRPIEML